MSDGRSSKTFSRTWGSVNLVSTQSIALTPMATTSLETVGGLHGKSSAQTGGTQSNFMNKHQELVKIFHLKFGLTVNDAPTLSPKDDALRVELIREELEELKQGIAKNDRVEIADALADLEYVILGAGVTYGLALEPISLSARHKETLDHDLYFGSELEFLKGMLEHGALEHIAITLNWLIFGVEVYARFHSIPLTECFEEVHRSNMSKLWTAEELDALSKVWEATEYEGSHFYKFSNGNTAERKGDDERRWLVKRADGKALKSPSYSPADIAGVLARQEAQNPASAMVTLGANQNAYSAPTATQETQGRGE